MSRSAGGSSGTMADLGSALRYLVRNPGFFMATAGTLALGIGAAVAILSAADAALFRPLPYPQANELVRIYKTSLAREGRRLLTWPEFQEWRQRGTTLRDAAGFQPASVIARVGDRRTVVPAARVTANFFDVLGVRAERGATFAAGDDAVGGPLRVVLTYGFWQRVFGGDAKIVGGTLVLDGQPHEIGGVLPADFRFGFLPAAEIWLPVNRSAAARADRNDHWLSGVGRLRRGADAAAATRELTAIAQEMGALHGTSEPAASVLPFRDQLVGPSRPLLMLTMSCAALLLLSASVTVATLLMVRATAREAELALRSALGAGQIRVARTVLFEALLVGLAGALLAMPLAATGLWGLLHFVPPSLAGQMPYLADAAVDRRAFAIACLAALLVAAASGLWPVARVRGMNLHAVLKRSGRAATAHRGRNLLVSFQCALAVVLLVGATMFARSFTRLLRVDPGFDPSQAMVAHIRLPASVAADVAAQLRFWNGVQVDAERLPGAVASGLTTLLPLEPGNWNSIAVPGQEPRTPDQARYAVYRAVSVGYREALGLPLMSGRWLDARDTLSSAPAFVISARTARTMFGAASPLGRALSLGGMTGTVVGVVGDMMAESLDEAPTMAVYFALELAPPVVMRLVLRGPMEPAATEQALQRLVRVREPDAAVFAVRPLDGLVAESPAVFRRRFPMVLIAAFAAVALVLSAIGVYGALSYAVRLRRREFGVRLALGARGSHLAGLVLRHAAIVAGGGLLAGLAAAWLGSRLIASLLFGVTPDDPLSYAAVAVALAAVAFLAASRPMQRALAAHPSEVLRDD